MKLLAKTQVYYLSLLLVLLIFWSGIFLYAISLVLEDSIDETLYSELQVSIEQFQDNDAESFLNYAKKSSLLDYNYISSIHTKKLFYSDTLLYNSVEQEDIPYRQVHAEIMASGKPVRITLRKSLIEYDDLFSAIIFTELIFIMLLITGMYILNRGLLVKIWQPFFTTLERASEYRLSQKGSLHLPNADIQEFDQLNEVLMGMMAKIEHDYHSLKQFTENASHEIQTPLSVIITRIEMLLQDEQFDENQWESIKDVYQAANRLSRINKALLLLAKIENRHFEEKQTVNMSKMLTELLNEFDEQIRQKKISITAKIMPSNSVSGNEELTEVLLRNLLVNAIRHNTGKGEIAIELLPGTLNITNSGKEPEQDLSMYFNRFYKADINSNSLGLGLAIVKEICVAQSFEYDYSYQNHQHIFTLKFQPLQ